MKRAGMRIGAFLLAVLFRLLALTWRVERLGPGTAQGYTQKGPSVLAVLHGHQLPLLLLHRNRPVDLMISRSRDGEWLSSTIHYWGYRAIRGGSSSGGVPAFLSARRSLRDGRIVAIAVDGPRGPAGQIQPGAQKLASVTDSPIVAVHVEASRAWRLASWDSFLIPKPFAKIVLRYALDPELDLLQDP